MPKRRKKPDRISDLSKAILAKADFLSNDEKQKEDEFIFDEDTEQKVKILAKHLNVSKNKIIKDAVIHYLKIKNFHLEKAMEKNNNEK